VVSDYTVDELVRLAADLKKLGVYRLKAGGVEMDFVPPLAPSRPDPSPEDTEQAIKDARDELDRELHGAS
jgi:hypothetical protein